MVIGNNNIVWETIKRDTNNYIAFGHSSNYGGGGSDPSYYLGESTWMAISNVSSPTEWRVYELLKNVTGNLSLDSIKQGNSYIITGSYVDSNNRRRYPLAKLDLNNQTIVSFISVIDDPGTNQNHCYNSICYGNGMYVAAGYKGVAYSYSDPDSAASPTFYFKRVNSISDPSREISWKSICYGSGRFVMISEEGDEYAYSTDGVNWTVRIAPFTFAPSTLSPTMEYRYNSILAYGGNNNLFVAILKGGRLAYSSDGVEWADINTSFSISAITANAKVFFGSSSDFDAYSKNGIDWEYGRNILSYQVNSTVLVEEF